MQTFSVPTHRITDAIQLPCWGYQMLAHERLKELLHYSPETGIFTWLVDRQNGTCVGDVAGGDNGKGYIQISIDNVRYRANRLAWFYTHGVWPTFEIDHFNGIKSDNKFCNLRDVTRNINAQNVRKAMRDSGSGVLGAFRLGKKFQASITANGKQIYLGLFVTPEQAHVAYIKAKRQMHAGCTL